jgi:hypothetical protein
VATEASVMVEVAARPGKVLTLKAAAATEMTSAKAAHMAAAEAATHMTATTETTAVSTTTAASPAARERVSSQSPGESGCRSQNDHRLTQHWTYSFGRDCVHSTGNIVIAAGSNCANQINASAQT